MDSRNFECFDSPPQKKKKMEIFWHGLLMALNWHWSTFISFYYLYDQKIQHTFVKSLSALRKKEIESLP